jgi:hypothetical protein
LADAVFGCLHAKALQGQQQIERLLPEFGQRGSISHDYTPAE